MLYDWLVHCIEEMQLSISIPKELYEKIKAKNPEWQPFSQTCVSLFEKGLKVLEREEELTKEAFESVFSKKLPG
jgi:hypothetical protein